MKPVIKIARAVIVKGENILLCHNLRDGHYFLPGGHVEVGETPEIALRREMVEEMGFEPTFVKFLLDFPNAYIKNGISYDEVATIFLAKIDVNEIVSRENQIAFEWIPIKNLPTANFKPKESVNLIMKVLRENNLTLL